MVQCGFFTVSTLTAVFLPHRFASLDARADRGYLMEQAMTKTPTDPTHQLATKLLTIALAAEPGGRLYHTALRAAETFPLKDSFDTDRPHDDALRACLTDAYEIIRADPANAVARKMAGDIEDGIKQADEYRRRRGRDAAPAG